MRGDGPSRGGAELLAWYDRQRRDLPWRRAPTPWTVLVAELMLQQTRVATVIPYHAAFLARFPTPEALAAAPETAALAAWSGLGYYRRARQLHAAAREIAEHGFPRRAADLERLPGIGPYTAAAVASIAFGEAVPVLDGNVARVVARLLAWPSPIETAASRRTLRAGAGALLEPLRPGDSNQALMELGATLCRPRAPLCLECPLAPGCAARAAGSAEELPRRRAPRPTERVGLVAAVAVDAQRRVLLFRRSDGEALLAGLWELPQAPRGRGAARALAARYGGRFVLRRRLGTTRHAITWRALEVEVRRAEWCPSGPSGAEVGEGLEAGWWSAADLPALPLSALAEKVLAVAGWPPSRRAVNLRRTG